MKKVIVLSLVAVVCATGVISASYAQTTNKKGSSEVKLSETVNAGDSSKATVFKNNGSSIELVTRDNGATIELATKDLTTDYSPEDIDEMIKQGHIVMANAMPATNSSTEAAK